MTPEISKARLRIFYKGLNRNDSYITDEFASKLLSTLPYTPVVGIYNDLTKEFDGHAEDRNVANIYGVVPENPNASWEDHLDKDGVMRTYACCDVYLYTGRFEAAKRIVGKQHSMELDTDSIVGDWKPIDADGYEAFVYDDARFIGLSVLGDRKEPCFEGSAFFELVKKFSNFMAVNSTNGGEDMALEQLKPTGESSPVETEVMDEEEATTSTEEDTPSSDSEAEKETPSSDSAADCGDPEKEKFEDKPKDEEPSDEEPSDEDPEEEESSDEKPKDDEPADSAMDGGGQEVPSGAPATTTQKTETQVSETASAPANSAMDGGGQEVPSGSPATTTQKSETTVSDTASFEAQILDLKSQVSTYESEAKKYKDLYTALKADYDVLAAEKAKQISAKKKAKIDEYATLVSAEVKADFEAKLDTYASVDDLEKDLLFAAKPSLFANQNYAPSSFDSGEEDGLAALIKQSIKH